MDEVKLYNNGNNLAVVSEDDFGFSFEDLIGDTNMGLLGCNLRNYTIDVNNGVLSDARDVFRWVLSDKKITGFKFTPQDLINEYGEDYNDWEAEECKIDPNKNYSIEEMKDLLLLLDENGLLDDGDYYNICNSIEFEDFYITPFYAYIHSGISISLADPNDAWDSGIAGFAWVEAEEGQSLEEAKKYFEEDFSRYNDYLSGAYTSFYVRTFEKDGSTWKEVDSVTYIEQSIDDVWEALGLSDVEESDFSEDTYQYVRENRQLSKEDVIDYIVNNY